MSARAIVAVFIAVASSVANADPLKLVVPDFNAVGPSKDKAVFFTEHISSRLSEVGAQVTTARGLQQLLGIERQRQLVGCANEGTSCVAELASALGTDGLLLGDVAQIESLFQINLRVISGADGKVVASHQARVNSERELLDELDQAAFALAADAALALGRDAPRAPKSRGPSLRALSAIPFAVAVASAAVSATFFVLAANNYGRIPQMAGATPLPTSEVESLGRAGATYQTVGWVLGATAGAALVAAGTMFFLGKSSPSPLSTGVAPVAGGAAFLVGGSW